MSYLETYVNSVSYMPEDVLRYLDHVRKMDDRLNEAMDHWNKHREEFLRVSQSPDKDAHADKLKRLKDMLQLEETLIRQFSAEKIASAKQAELLVKSNHARLEDAITKLNTELRVSEARMHDSGFYDAGDRGRRRRPEPAVYDDMNYLGMEEEISGAQGSEQEIFCKCQRPSEGNMVGCDNQKVSATQCAIKWFHFACVGLTEEPDGDWFCSPECEAAAKAR